MTGERYFSGEIKEFHGEFETTSKFCFRAQAGEEPDDVLDKIAREWRELGEFDTKTKTYIERCDGCAWRVEGWQELGKSAFDVVTSGSMLNDLTPNPNEGKVQ